MDRGNGRRDKGSAYRAECSLLVIRPEAKDRGTSRANPSRTLLTLGGLRDPNRTTRFAKATRQPFP